MARSERLHQGASANELTSLDDFEIGKVVGRKFKSRNINTGKISERVNHFEISDIKVEDYPTIAPIFINIRGVRVKSTDHSQPVSSGRRAFTADQEWTNLANFNGPSIDELKIFVANPLVEVKPRNPRKVSKVDIFGEKIDPRRLKIQVNIGTDANPMWSVSEPIETQEDAEEAMRKVLGTSDDTLPDRNWRLLVKGVNPDFKNDPSAPIERTLNPTTESTRSPGRPKEGNGMQKRSEESEQDLLEAELRKVREEEAFIPSHGKTAYFNIELPYRLNRPHRTNMLFSAPIESGDIQMEKAQEIAMSHPDMDADTKEFLLEASTQRQTASALNKELDRITENIIGKDAELMAGVGDWEAFEEKYPDIYQAYLFTDWVEDTSDRERQFADEEKYLVDKDVPKDWREKMYAIGHHRYLDDARDAVIDGKQVLREISDRADELRSPGRPQEENAVTTKNEPSADSFELKLLIDNDSELYSQRYESMLENQKKKLGKKVYDPALSEKLWKHLADAGAKKYQKDSAYSFSPDVRREVAKMFREEFEDVMKEEGFMGGDGKPTEKAIEYSMTKAEKAKVQKKKKKVLEEIEANAELQGMRESNEIQMAMSRVKAIIEDNPLADVAQVIDEDPALLGGMEKAWHKGLPEFREAMEIVKGIVGGDSAPTASPGRPQEYSDLTGEPKRTENPTVLEGQAGFALGSSRDMNPYEKALKEMSGEEPYDDERHAFLKKLSLQWDTGYHMAEAEDRRQADAHLSSPGRADLEDGGIYQKWLADKKEEVEALRGKSPSEQYEALYESVAGLYGSIDYATKRDDPRIQRMRQLVLENPDDEYFDASHDKAFNISREDSPDRYAIQYEQQWGKTKNRPPEVPVFRLLTPDIWKMMKDIGKQANRVKADVFTADLEKVKDDDLPKYLTARADMFFESLRDTIEKNASAGPVREHGAIVVEAFNRLNAKDYQKNKAKQKRQYKALDQVDLTMGVIEELLRKDDENLKGWTPPPTGLGGKWYEVTGPSALALSTPADAHVKFEPSGKHLKPNYPSTTARKPTVPKAPLTRGTRRGAVKSYRDTSTGTTFTRRGKGGMPKSKRFTKA